MKRYRKFMSHIMMLFLIVSSCNLSVAIGKQEVKAAKGDQIIDDVFVVNGTTLRDYTGEEEHVIVPDGITCIGQGAFIGCKAKTITLPDSVVEIETNGFASCPLLEKVTFSNNVKKIGDMAFWFSEKLKEISSMEGVEEIESLAFAGTLWLEEQRKKDPLVVVNTILVDGKTCKGEVEIPNTVTEIVGDAFSVNEELLSVTIPDSVKKIGSAFDDCRHLKTVKMGNGVEQIDSQAFRFCTRMENIRLSNSLKAMPSLLFENCGKIEEITIPESAKEISLYAFRNCKSLKAITFPNSFEIPDASLYELDPGVTIYGYNVKNSDILQKIAKENGIPCKELALTTKAKTLKPKQSYRLKLNSGAKCTWKSSKPSVASVNYYGLVKAKKKGTTTITATIYGQKYTCKITVK